MPPRRSTILQDSTLQRSADLQFRADMDRDLAELTWPSMLEQGIGSLRGIYDQATSQSESHPYQAPMPAPLPVVVSPEPELRPVQPRPQEEMRAIPVQPPGGTPESMPTGLPTAINLPSEPSRALTTPPAPGVADTRPAVSGGAPAASPQASTQPQSAPRGGSHPEKQAEVYRQARASGLDEEGARILVAVTETEGGLEGAIGDHGQSRGPFQFYEGGQMPGFRAWLTRQGIQGDPNTLVNDITLATRYAAEGYLGRAIQAGRSAGLSGADLATYVQQHGQVSIDPWKTGQNYQRLFGGQPAPAPNAGAAPVPAASAAPPPPPATSSAASPPAADGSGGGGMYTVRDQWGNTFEMTPESFRKRPGGTADLIVLQEPGQRAGPTMQRVSLGTPQPMPEDASESERFVQSLTESNEPKPSPLQNVVPYDPNTHQTGPTPTDAAETMMQRAPLLPTDPEASTGAEYDPRDADSGPRESYYRMPPTIYGDAGDEPQVPAYQPTYGPAPAPAPSPAIAAIESARAGMADDEELAPRPSIVERATAPAASVYGPAIAEANQTQDEIQARNREKFGQLAQMAAVPLETVNRAVAVANAVLLATPQATAETINAALDTVGLGRDELGVDVPIVGRVGVADIIDVGPFTTVGLGRASSAFPSRGIAAGIERGTGAAVRAGSRAVGAGLTAAGEAIESGGHRALDALEAGAERVGEAWQQGRRVAAEANAADTGGRTLNTIGPAPEPEVRIPRAGYATDISPGAEQMVREASEANAPRETVRRAEVARKAEDILGADPDAVQRWQSEALAEAPEARAVRGEALRQAEYIDAENADRAIERLREAQQRAREHVGRVQDMAADDRFDAADALLEAAETARAFGISARASTAEGRAAARALNQRRNAITARQAFVTAERARQVGQDAAFAAREAKRAARTGQVTTDGAARLRTLRDKLLEAERHGLTGDGANGRLDAMDARRATPETAAVVAGPAPAPNTRVTSAARPGVPLGTRVATDVGNVALGSIVGTGAGLAAPSDTPEERRRNALLGLAIGAGGFPAAGRLLRGGRGRGALAAFGPAPTPEIPNRAIAVGADPSRRYEFRYRVADLRELVPSNTPSGAPNPAFPRELQPRARERVASQLQIDQIARGLEPDALLTDVGRLDSGPMIVGPDLIVESGNGRTLALQRAAAEYPERYQAYVDALRRDLGQYGLSESDLAGKDLPVLVRERVSDVDRAAFAQEANNAGLLRMSSFEQAVQDAGNLSDDVVTALQVGENDTIASALRKTENRDLVRQWVGTLPENERAGVLDAAGQLSAQGYERLTNALLVRTYGQGAGERLARTFIESADPTVRNVQTALMASLPDVARAEALIRSGVRDAGLSIADDVAAATEMLARLRRDGIPVREYLGQAAMFERELTPMQEDILRFLDDNNRRWGGIRDTLREYASRVENAADPNQGAMFGDEVAAVSREDAWRGATANVEREHAARQAARRTRANGAGLAQPDAESLAQPEDIIPSTSGPEGRLAVEGAPEPVARPGAVPEGMAPRGGPDAELRRGVAEDRSVPAGGAIEAPSGGPEGGLRRQVAEDRSVSAGEAIEAPSGGPEAGLRRQVVDDRSAPAGPVSEDIARTGGPEDTLTLSSGRSIKDVAAQIDDVLANPNAPGAAERLRDLHQDLQEISAQGFARSSDIRRRLQRNGLLRAGLASKDTDVTPLVEALARVDPDKPEEMRAVLEVLSRPRLIDRLLEYQYVNMLSSPVTQAVNIASNAAQIAGRLLLQNPLEFAYSGGRSTGVGAAFEGAGRGFREGLGEARQIMRTGTSSEQIDRALEMGDYGRVQREYLTETFGKAGALLHVISTRPLAAMDALLGHVAYASAAEQFAQRKADQLLRSGAESVRGMSRQQARQHVMANIWDHPDIIERAGKIEDYTLLRSKDTEGAGWGHIERGLRFLASARNVPEGAGADRQAIAFLTNQVMPFFNVPLNAAKQGAERSIGVPINAVRAARAYARGDVERGAELAAKATIGAAAVGTATVLAMGDNITGDGPSEDGQRAIWELTHRRNSWRVPGTDTWFSWEGTPFAIPFGMVAGAAEGIREASQRSAKKGQTDTGDVVGAALLKGAQGAGQGFASQSFVRALGDQYQLLTGRETGLSTVANQGASSVSRFVPASGMLNFFARVAADVERDTGRPQAFSDLPEATGARIAARLPGTRQQLDPRLNAYGEPQRRVPPAPYYRGAGDMTGDPITRTLEEKQVGAPSPITEITFRGMTVPLTIPEQHRFQQAWRRAFRRELEGIQATGGEYPPEAYERARSEARAEAVGAILERLGPDEIRRRVEGRVAAAGAR